MPRLESLHQPTAHHVAEALQHINVFLSGPAHKQASERAGWLVNAKLPFHPTIRIHSAEAPCDPGGDSKAGALHPSQVLPQVQR